MHVKQEVERDERWRLFIPDPRTNPRVTLDIPAAKFSSEVFAFKVANGHLPAAAQAPAEAQAVPEHWFERDAGRLHLDEAASVEWVEGERAAIFEVDVPRNQVRTFSVSGPSSLAWALFEPGLNGGMRSLATASAVGFAGGTSQVKLQRGTWALVLFHDGEIVPTDSVDIVFDNDGAKALPLFLADAHELRRFVLGTLALAVVVSLTEAGRVFLSAGGDIWTSLAAAPIGVAFLLFPASFAVSTLYHCFFSMRILRGEQAHRSSTFANRPLKIKGMRWPNVTIQIPTFREPFEAAIRPTLDSARRAAERYRKATGATCNVLVCDDGLLCFASNDLNGAVAEASKTPPAARSVAQSELLARINYYETTDVAFVARPWPQPGVPGTERAGRFRKASNLNYALRLADSLERSEPLSEEHARFRTTLSARARALGVSRGDVSVGEIIVQLDKDSVMAPDVIVATIPEFLADPTLGYTQHSTYPTNEDRYFSAMMGWFTRLLFDLAIRSKCLIGGSLVPMLGHNLFLRREDLMRAGGWHEHSVCEDLELMMRLHTMGKHGKYICYPGQDFGEAVTRVYTEELEKFRRYAFGAAEAVINPITDWERRGILKPSWRRFYRSEHVRWYQVLDLLQFFFSLINIASIIPFAILTGFGLAHPYRALSMGLLSFALFGIVSIPAMYMLRRQGNLKTLQAGRIWRPPFGGFKATFLQFMLGFSFIGCSLAVLSGALAHLFNRPIVFGATSMDALGELTRRQHLRSSDMRKAVRDAALLIAICTVLILWQVYLASLPRVPGTESMDWRFHAVWIYPLALTAIAPFIFHPYLMGGPDLPWWLARRRRRGADHSLSMPEGHEQTVSRRQEVS